MPTAQRSDALTGVGEGGDPPHRPGARQIGGGAGPPGLGGSAAPVASDRADPLRDGEVVSRVIDSGEGGESNQSSSGLATVSALAA
jgi:hypothetical protein